jgi:alpha-glucoside transport system substrate-binding protein
MNRVLRVSSILLMVSSFLLIAAASAIAGGNREKGDRVGQSARPGGTVALVASWSGNERAVLMDMLKPFEDRTGIKVNYTGTRDIAAVITTRVAAGNPPDLAAFSNPAQMRDLARRGNLKPLDGVLDTKSIERQYSPGWIERGTVNGRLYGIFTKVAAKGFIWYDVRAASKVGLTPRTAPATWQGLLDLSRRIEQREQAAGSTAAPWAIGVESGAASGWVGTDWLESIFLKKYGPQEYVRWYRGEIPWTSDEVRSVWSEWGKIVADPKMLYGGTDYVLGTNFGTAFEPLFEVPPGAYLHFQATFITGFIHRAYPDLEPVRDYDFFRFPAIDPRYAKSIEASGDVYSMFSDTPQAQALIRYVATPEAQQYWLATGAISPNKMVPISAYSDPITRQAAQMMNKSEIVVFDASDLMPNQMNQAFWKAVLDFIRDPGSLDSILAGLDRVRKEAYR